MKLSQRYGILPTNDLIKPTNLLPERMLTKVEILKQEFKTEKRETKDWNRRLQEDLGNVGIRWKFRKTRLRNGTRS